MSKIAFLSGSNGSEEFGQLQFAVSDADGIAEALSGMRCQFEVVRPKSDTSPYQFRELLDKAAASCKTEDTFIFYFAGHGVLDSGELFLILDNTNSQLQTTALPTDDILASMRRCRARNKLLILDCCHAGGAIRFRSSGTVPVEELKLDSANHLILMASGRLERVRESERLGGGFLSKKICAALGEKFHEADADQDLCLTIDELMDFLEKETAWHNSVYPKQKVPVPYLFGEKKGNFFLTPDKSPWAPYEIQWPEDSVMVLLPIPPQHDWYGQKRELSKYAFAIGKYPITNAQYRSFLRQGGAKTYWPHELSGKQDYSRGVEKEFINLLPEEPKGGRFDFDTQEWVGPFSPWESEDFNDPLKPVVCVSFNEALSYSRWVHELASEKFPGTFTYIVTEQLWEIAAFGTDSGTRWARRRHRALSTDFESSSRYTGKAHQNKSSPTRIDTEGKRINQYGVTDMIGNIWEWCGSMNGLFCRFGFEECLAGYPERISLRGGGFLDDIERVNLILSEHEIPKGKKSRHFDHGFRIASMIPIRTLPDEIQRRLQLCPPVELVGSSIDAIITEAGDW
ncbi:MAG: SUMF1/EgtB/PvdO family nonheme iron enzyme [Scytonema hyalinum WJT4-NPBG1]|jgi:formylglycine-generating enzyme required for sulfatase activity|nr:SUMF1/EgtB/PvdO family nonheme iron enzyme [Scytonema hyalinum WJT4-NPBG1]